MSNRGGRGGRFVDEFQFPANDGPRPRWSHPSDSEFRGRGNYSGPPVRYPSYCYRHPGPESNSRRTPCPTSDVSYGPSTPPRDRNNVHLHSNSDSHSPHHHYDSSYYCYYDDVDVGDHSPVTEHSGRAVYHNYDNRQRSHGDAYAREKTSGSSYSSSKSTADDRKLPASAGDAQFKNERKYERNSEKNNFLEVDAGSRTNQGSFCDGKSSRSKNKNENKGLQSHYDNVSEDGSPVKSNLNIEDLLQDERLKNVLFAGISKATAKLEQSLKCSGGDTSELVTQDDTSAIPNASLALNLPQKPKSILKRKTNVERADQANKINVDSLNKLSTLEKTLHMFNDKTGIVSEGYESAKDKQEHEKHVQLKSFEAYRAVTERVEKELKPFDVKEKLYEQWRQSINSTANDQRASLKERDISQVNPFLKKTEPVNISPLDPLKTVDCGDGEELDSTVQNVLQSIGFNFDLSKRMQELARQKKKQQDVLSTAIINQSATFLGKGEVMMQDVRAALFSDKHEEAHIDNLIKEARASTQKNRCGYDRSASPNRSRNISYKEKKYGEGCQSSQNVDSSADDVRQLSHERHSETRQEPFSGPTHVENLRITSRAADNSHAERFNESRRVILSSEFDKRVLSPSHAYPRKRSASPLTPAFSKERKVHDNRDFSGHQAMFERSSFEWRQSPTSQSADHSSVSCYKSPLLHSTQSVFSRLSEGRTAEKTNSPMQNDYYNKGCPKKSPDQHKFQSTFQYQSRSPGRRLSRSPDKRVSNSPVRRMSRSPIRRVSRSPGRRMSRSPGRRVSRSPGRRVSISPRRRVSISPCRRMSRSRGRRGSRSPGRRVSRSPGRRLSRSPGRRLSRSPGRRLSRSPNRRVSKSPNGRVARSPNRRVSKSPRRRISRSPGRRMSRSPRRQVSKSPGRQMSKSPQRRMSRSPGRRMSRSPGRKMLRSRSHRSCSRSFDGHRKSLERLHSPIQNRHFSQRSSYKAQPHDHKLNSISNKNQKVSNEIKKNYVDTNKPNYDKKDKSTKVDVSKLTPDTMKVYLQKLLEAKVQTAGQGTTEEVQYAVQRLTNFLFEEVSTSRHRAHSRTLDRHRISPGKHHSPLRRSGMHGSYLRAFDRHRKSLESCRSPIWSGHLSQRSCDKSQPHDQKHINRDNNQKVANEIKKNEAVDNKTPQQTDEIKKQLPSSDQNEMVAAEGGAGLPDGNVQDEDKLDKEMKQDSQISSSSHYDNCIYWCRHCSFSCRTLKILFQHNHSSKHLLKIEHEKKPWKDNNKKKASERRSVTSKTRGIKGAEMMFPIIGFYCSLCKISCKDFIDSEDHIMGNKHYDKYMEYVKQNPLYENSLLLEKNKVLALKKNKSTKETLPSQPSPQLMKELEITEKTDNHDFPSEMGSINKNMVTGGNTNLGSYDMDSGDSMQKVDTEHIIVPEIIKSLTVLSKVKPLKTEGFTPEVEKEDKNQPLDKFMTVKENNTEVKKQHIPVIVSTGFGFKDVPLPEFFLPPIISADSFKRGIVYTVKPLRQVEEEVEVIGGEKQVMGIDENATNETPLIAIPSTPPSIINEAASRPAETPEMGQNDSGKSDSVSIVSEVDHVDDMNKTIIISDSEDFNEDEISIIHENNGKGCSNDIKEKVKNINNYEGRKQNQNIADVMEEFKSDVGNEKNNTKGVAEVIEEGKSIADLVEEGKHIADVIEEGKHIADVSEDGKIIADVVEEGKSIADVIEDSKSIADVNEMEQIIADVVEEGKSIADVIEDSKSIADVNEMEQIIADVIEEGKSTADVIEEGNSIADVTEGESIADVFEEGKSISDVIEDDKSIGDIIDDKKCNADYVKEEEENIVDALEDKRRKCEGLEEDIDILISVDPSLNKTGIKKKKGEVKKIQVEGRITRSKSKKSNADIQVISDNEAEDGKVEQDADRDMPILSSECSHHVRESGPTQSLLVVCLENLDVSASTAIDLVAPSVDESNAKVVPKSVSQQKVNKSNPQLESPNSNPKQKVSKPNSKQKVSKSNPKQEASTSNTKQEIHLSAEKQLTRHRRSSQDVTFKSWRSYQMDGPFWD